MLPLKPKKEPSFTSSCVYWTGSNGEMLLDLGVNMKATYHGDTTHSRLQMRVDNKM